MEEQELTIPQNKKNVTFIEIVLFVLTLSAIGFISKMSEYGVSQWLKAEIIGVILLTVILFYSKSEKKMKTFYQYRIFTIGYIILLICLLLSQYYYLFNWVLIGSLLIAFMVDVQLGILVNILFVMLSYLLTDIEINMVVYYLIYITAACILTKYLRNTKLIISILVILLSFNVTLLFVINSFVWDRLFADKLINISATTVAAFVVVYLFYIIYEKKGRNVNMDKELNRILSEDFGLISQLKELSEELYKHSVEVAFQSYNAAKVIGANEDLAKAGGLYHEIGKIVGGSVPEGIELANQHNFPKQVIDILEEYNTTIAIPTSRESAIVMLTESLVSTLEYVKSMPEKKAASIEKIVESVFNARYSKNTLDESGLSIGDYKKLKQFFIEEYSNK